MSARTPCDRIYAAATDGSNASEQDAGNTLDLVRATTVSGLLTTADQIYVAHR